MECPECGDEINGEQCSNCVFNINEVEVNNIFNIYVLKCQDLCNYKYYVGKTNNDVNIRFSQHKNNQGYNNCAFTSKYKPIEIIETFKSKDPLDEDKITKKYMMKYGIENVRGGSYTKLELDEWMIKSLEHEFKSTRDICYKCNEKGHLYRDCPLDNKFNIDKYIEGFNNLDSIDIEINKLEKVYEQIIILNCQINTTKSFNPNINKQEYEEKLNKINEEYNKLHKCSNSLSFKELQEKKELLRKEQEIARIKLSEINSSDDIGHINNVYKTFFVNDIIYMRTDVNKTIKKYKLYIFHLEKKKELKGLLNIHISEDLIKMKLSGLYEKKISILQRGLFSIIL